MASAADIAPARRTLRGRSAKAVVPMMLDKAGITIGGDAPYDITVNDDRFYARVIRDGSLGMGESYMDGWWDSPQPDELLTRIVRARLDRAVRTSPKLAAMAATARVVNMQSKRRSSNVVEQHYDVNDDVYEAMLDSRRTYSCGYWRAADSLDDAQEAKLDLICRKIGLREGMSVLDIGCGWGSFAGFAAEHYGARVTAINIAPGQLAYARDRYARLPIDFRLQDYRDVAGSFDAIVSVGMFEHVGSKNYRTYMEVLDRCLAPDGVALLHTIAGNISGSGAGPWITKYVFPGGELPTLPQLGAAIEDLLVPEDLHNFGPDYDRTLMEWDARFEAAWPQLSARYDERFRRMWRYYLLSSAAGFRSRSIQLFQLVLSRVGTPQRNWRHS